MRNYRRIAAYILLIIPLLTGLSCLTQEKNESKVALTYCKNCHLLPQPKLLDKNTWAFAVLPQMATRLGYRVIGTKTSDINGLKAAHLYPDVPQLKQEDWEEIKAYFIGLAPSQTQAGKDILDINPYLKGFKVLKPQGLKTSPLVTMVEYNEGKNNFFWGNGADNSLNIYEPKSGNHKIASLAGAPSHLTIAAEGYYVLTMGQVMPHNQKSGTLSFIPINADGKLDDPEIWIDDLPRPVFANLTELDGDGKADMVICAFGHLQGELIWYSNVTSPNREKRILRPLPGALKTEIIDFNKDGHLDILALMGQGDEGFFLYLNDGKGHFSEKKLMGFHPSQGSTYFKWQDLDGDGLEDILYVNGDNGDYTSIVKDFHGIHFFKNKGNMKFEEVLFLEHHGAFKVIADDFDKDGDLDLAAISYFPDYNDRPLESFIYYKNKGQFDYEATTFEDQPSGKWLTMDAGDIDGDGDQDLMLGSAFFMMNDVPSDVARNWRKGASPILLLKNLW